MKEREGEKKKVYEKGRCPMDPGKNNTLLYPMIDNKRMEFPAKFPIDYFAIFACHACVIAGSYYWGILGLKMDDDRSKLFHFHIFSDMQ